jgi:HlyD family secretion protein
MFSKIFKQILRHKLLTGIILLLVIGSIYFGYQKLAGDKNTVRYATTAVEKGTLIVSVSGSGQVSALDQVDVKPKVSGEIVALYISKDQEVKAGSLIVELDSKDARQAIQDAEINLENANFTLEELEKSKEGAETDLVKTYEDVLNNISDTFNDLPAIMEKLEKMFLESSYGGDQADIDYYRNLVGTYTGQSFLTQEEKENYFIRLRDKYDEVRKEYLSITRLSPPETLENFLEKTYTIDKEIAELTRSSRDIVVSYKETLKNQSLTPPIPASTTDTQLTDINNFTNSLTQQVTNLLLDIQTIDKCKETIESYERDIQSQQLSIEQEENALSDAKEKLADYSIRAPLDGVIAETDIKKGDSVSSATVLATLITHQKIAEITLNEVDVAKVKVGQKATLTFDALPDLSISGKVLEVDMIGTVSQGVVSYGVKIAFDTEEEKVKPGMSVTADIITDAKQDVLVLPNSAIKSQGNSYYVELVEASEEMKQQLLTNTSGTILPTPPKSQPIEVGLSNDLSTEIVSGLKEGDIVVTSTITPTKTQTTQTQTNQSRGNQEFQIPGL